MARLIISGPAIASEVEGLYFPYVLSCGRNSANSTDIWLRDGNGLPLNLTPYRVPFDCVLEAISATGNASQTWDAEVYLNADVRAGGTPLDANKVAELSLVSSTGAQVTGLTVSLSAGDEIGVFCRGTNVSYPRVSIWLARSP